MKDPDKHQTDKPNMCAFCWAEEPHTKTFKGRHPKTQQRVRACANCGLREGLWLSRAEMRRLA